MNKQELIERIKKAKSFKLDESIINGPIIDFVGLNTVIKLVNQVNDTQKVKIPQFVADIIEGYKEKNAPIMDIFSEKFSNKQYNNWLIRSLNAYDRAARAWLDGYEVDDKDEKLYKVRIPKAKNHINQSQFLCKKGVNYFFCGNDIGRFRTKFEKRELEEAGFGWVFNCEGVEIEESYLWS
nr:MAG TPA: Protein of unknown function (DUF1642) [Caudoviricetes sp.]